MRRSDMGKKVAFYYYFLIYWGDNHKDAVLKK